jgi:hypothetical protein
MQPLRAALSGFATTAQPKWAAWRRRLQLDEHLPESFAVVIAEVAAFADPLLIRGPLNATWNPATASWTQRTVT